MNKLIPAAVAAMSLGAYAAETNETATAELPPVVVEASRIGKTPNEIPSAVQVITRGEIAASGAKDVVDLLQKKSVSLDFAHLGGANPALTQLAPHGYGENGFGRLLIVVDGERLNSPDMNAPNLAQIGLGAIERIEILQGSQNVLHGDVGSAGMINIITDPNDYETHGAIELHGGSWNTIGASASLRGGVKDWGTQYWVNGGWDHSDGYRHDSGFDSYYAGGGVKQNFDNGSYVRLSAFWSDVDSDLPGYLSRYDWKHHPTHSDGYHDFYRRTTYGLNATAYGVINEDNAVRLKHDSARRVRQRADRRRDVPLRPQRRRELGHLVLRLQPLEVRVRPPDDGLLRAGHVQDRRGHRPRGRRTLRAQLEQVHDGRRSAPRLRPHRVGRRA